MSCTPVNTFAIPGPQGPAGTPGTFGTDGVDAFTFLTASFVMPAESAAVIVAVTDSTWMVLGQVVFTSAGAGTGYFLVDLLPDGTSVSLINLRNTAAGAYPQNSAPGTTFTVGGKIAPAGVQGPTGVPASGAFLVANNLSEGVAGTMRTSLGLGTVATFAQGNADTNVPRADGALVAGRAVFATAAGVETKTSAAAVAAIGAQPSDAFLTSIALLGTAADKTIYTTGIDTAAETSLTAYMRTLLAAIDATTARGLLGVNSGSLDYLLFRDQHANTVNSAAFTPGSPQVVPLNTEVADTGNHGSIAGNQITLAAGTYRYRFGVVSYKSGAFKAWLYNISDSADIASSYGQPGWVPQDGAQPEFGNGLVTGQGRFTLAVPKTISLKAQCNSTSLGCSFGAALSQGNTEVYSFLELEKE